MPPVTPRTKTTVWLFGKQITALACVLLVVHSCGGGSPAPGPAPPVSPPPPVSSQTDSEKLRDALQGLPLNAFYDASFDALAKRSPESYVSFGLPGELDDVSLNNLDERYLNETFEMIDVVRELLDTFDREALLDDEKIHYDVYRWYLDDEAARRPFRYHRYFATYFFFGFHNSTQRFLTEVHPLGTEQDALDYIERLGLVGVKFDQAMQLMDEQARRGIVEPIPSLTISRSQVSQLRSLAPASHPYYTGFFRVLNAVPSLNAQRRSELQTRARDAVAEVVIPAYQRLFDKIHEHINMAPESIGVGQFPDGEAYYQWALKHHTTTDLTAQQVHDLGVSELQRIRHEMRLLFDELAYPQDETLAELFERVANDGGIVPADQVQARYESLIEFARSRLNEAFDVFPQFDVVVEADPFGGGYYIRPSLDGSRPGAFYAGTSERPYYDMPTLTFHEALPGHHTQIALALEQDSPLFRKVLTFTGFVEGWALYAERLAYELGWYADDRYGDLGRLQFEALRAARLVMDTGIHDLGWSLDEARQFNEDNVGWSTSASQGAALRYSVYTGQATAYYVGMLQILDERQRAMDELGPLFDLTAFHRAVLMGGAVPLTVLPSVVDRYIQETLAAQ
ncbi:MAG: DUF885 domain-containing protein [Pseudomonadota bacterium]